jgi:hypothetical protein
MTVCSFSMACVKHISKKMKRLRKKQWSMLDESHKHYFLLIQHAQTSEEVPVQTKRIIEQYSPKDTIDHLVPIIIKGQQIGEFRDGDPFKLLFLYLSVITGLMLQDIPTAQDYWPQEVENLMRILTK